MRAEKKSPDKTAGEEPSKQNPNTPGDIVPLIRLLFPGKNPFANHGVFPILPGKVVLSRLFLIWEKESEKVYVAVLPTGPGAGAIEILNQ